MQMPLKALGDVDKKVVHGEMLGVSLLLEDVLTDGVPLITPPDDKTKSVLAVRYKKMFHYFKRKYFKRPVDVNFFTSQGPLTYISFSILLNMATHVYTKKSFTVHELIRPLTSKAP